MSTWGPPDLLLTENESWFVPHKVMAWGSNRKQEEDRRGSGDSRGERDGWRCVCGEGCRSHCGPLTTRVNTDDFSVRPCELTLLGETQEAGLE